MKPLDKMNPQEFDDFMKMMDNFKSKDDCPSSPICHAIGNLRPDCVAGGSVMANQSKFCMISVVALLGHISGITLKPTPSKEIEGFSGQDHDRIDPIQTAKPSSEPQ